MTEKQRGMIGIALIIFSLSWLVVLPLFPLKSNRVIQANLFATTSHVLLFFGYPSCRERCSATLQQLQNIYERCANPQHLSVVFVNLLKEMSQQQTQMYVEFFHNHFIGLAFSEILNSQFGVWFIPQPDGQLIHSDYIFLLENKEINQWVIKEVFKENQLSQLQCI